MTRKRLPSCSLIATVAIATVAVGPGCQPPQDSSEGDTVRVLVQPEPTRVELPPASIWEEPLQDPNLEAGREVWAGTCIQCHSVGLGGAPLIGSREAWGPRIAKGEALLIEHATRGFYGDVGEMPARGGNAALTDQQVAAAVRFMITRVPR